MIKRSPMLCENHSMDEVTIRMILHLMIAIATNVHVVLLSNK